MDKDKEPWCLPPHEGARELGHKPRNNLSEH